MTAKHDPKNPACACAQCEYRNSGQLDADDAAMWRDARHLKRKAPDLTHVRVEKSMVFNMKTMRDEPVVEIVERLGGFSALLMTMVPGEDANYAEEILSMARRL